MLWTPWKTSLYNRQNHPDMTVDGDPWFQEHAREKYSDVLSLNRWPFLVHQGSKSGGQLACKSKLYRGKIVVYVWRGVLTRVFILITCMNNMDEFVWSRQCCLVCFDLKIQIQCMGCLCIDKPSRIMIYVKWFDIGCTKHIPLINYFFMNQTTWTVFLLCNSSYIKQTVFLNIHFK